MTVTCPIKNHQVHVLVCIYRCPARVKAKCKEYFDNYEKIKELEVEQKYIDKYGEPVYVLPNAMRKRRKRRTKFEMECARAKEAANAREK